MSNEEYIAKVKKLSAAEWIREVLHDPSFLTDPYYKDLGRVLAERGEELCDPFQRVIDAMPELEDSFAALRLARTQGDRAAFLTALKAIYADTVWLLGQIRGSF
jgi:hypothetical protein